MRLSVIDRTAPVERALDALAGIPLKESGAPFHREIAACADGEALREALRIGSVFLVDEPKAVDGFLRAQPEGGVLLVSARPWLARGGVLRGLLEDRTLSDRRLAVLGLRRWSPEELDAARRFAPHMFPMTEVSREGLAETTDAVMALARSWPACHLIICMDVLDPAFAPGLRAPVPGGLTSRELLYVAQRLRLIATVRSAEVVLEGDGGAAHLAAQLIAELL